jgi:hypothetical protein
VRTPTFTLLALLVSVRAAAQQATDQRLHSAAPVVVRAVDSLVAQAAARGLPGEPVILKAIEGTAKGASPERVVAALGVVLERLGSAAAALREGGDTNPGPAAIEAGAFALSAGLDSLAVSSLARASAAAQAVEVTLRVSGTLAAIGVPSSQVVELVAQALRSGEPPAALLSLPARVQAGMARGASPAAAAAGVTHGQGQGQGRGRGPTNVPRRGPPPGKGPSSP